MDYSDDRGLNIVSQIPDMTDPDSIIRQLPKHFHCVIRLIYVSQIATGTVERFDLTGTPLGTFASVPNPRGIVFDTAGNLYVSEAASERLNGSTRAVLHWERLRLLPAHVV